MTYADVHAFCLIETFVAANLGDLFLFNPSLKTLFERVGANKTIKKHVQERKPTMI